MITLKKAIWSLLGKSESTNYQRMNSPIVGFQNGNIFRTTLDNLMEGCQIIGFDWTYIYINPAAEIHNRRPTLELFGKKYMDVWPGVENTKVFRSIKYCMEERTHQRIENEFIFSDGSSGWFDLSIQPIPEGVFILSIDITDRKRAEQALQIAHNRLSRFIDSNIVGIVIASADGRIIETNDYYLNLIGFTRSEFESGMVDWRAITPPEWILADEKALKELNESGTCIPYEKEYVKRDGTRIPVFLADAMLPGPEKQIAAFVLDNTERKKVEQELRKSENLFNKAFHGSPSPITIAQQKDGTYLAVNDSFLRLTELDREDVIGKNGLELNLVDPEERSKIRRELQEKGTLHNIEVSAKTSSGKSIFLLTSIENAELAGEPCTITTMLDITDRKFTELQLKEKNEEIEAQNEEYLQLNEELVQINEELEEAKERAEQSDNLKTAFLQNMSHEIRTPMNAIMGFSELLEEHYNNKEKLRKFARIIHQRSVDLLEIINGILDISKIESGQTQVHIEECKLDFLFADITEFFKELQNRHIKQQVEFIVDVQCQMINNIILTDRIKLKQILFNLIGNAFKFTDKGKINVGCKYEGDHQLLFFVKDTGIGIPANKYDFIFQRFTQLEQNPKHLYGGTGLGLPIVKGLIDLLGGKIWLESELNKGTTFYFSLPYQKKDFVSHEHTEFEVREKYNFLDRTLLIVEDDKYNTDYLKEILEVTGLMVLHSDNGNKAMEIFTSQKIDVVLMDIRLPDTDGYAVTRFMKKLRPELKVIAQTAYAASEDKEKAIDAGCSDFISKPIKRDKLLSMINKLLSSR